MKKILTGLAAAAASLVMVSTLTAAPASAATTGTWNGKLLSTGFRASNCPAGATGCQLKIWVGELDCRPFIGKDVNRCINENTTHDYRYPIIWNYSKVYNCQKYLISQGTKVNTAGVLGRLNNAKVTVNYGTWENFVRCA